MKLRHRIIAIGFAVLLLLALGAFAVIKVLRLRGCPLAGP